MYIGVKADAGGQSGQGDKQWVMGRVVKGIIMDQNRAGLDYEHLSPCLEISHGDMGMKSSLKNTSHRIGMLTHSVCRRETKLHSEPRGEQDNEFCVAACALMSELTDFYAVKAQGKAHKVRSQELEAETHGVNYDPNSASASPSEPTHRPAL